jgi:hypothetical protein
MKDFNVTPGPELDTTTAIDTSDISPVQVFQPSMSKSEQLLNCAYPWRKKVARQTPTFEMHYGSGFHEAMASLLPSPPRKIDLVQLAAKWQLDDTDDFISHVKHALERLIAWLRADNQWKFDFVKHAQAKFETAVAYDVMKRTARTIPPPSIDTHEYFGLADTELPGTTDMVIDKIDIDEKKAKKLGIPDVIVLDHKTGDYCDLPLESSQLKSLVQATTVRIKAKRPAGAIFHTPRDGSGGWIYADDFEKPMLKQHAIALKEAWQQIGSGTLKPGPYCTDCKAITFCPAHTSALVQLRTATGTALTKERIGDIHQTIAFWNAFAEKVDREVIRPWIKKNGAAVRPDGKVVDFTTKEVERISKNAVIEAEGAAAAEKVFIEWRKKGWLKKKPQEELRAMQDK